MFSKNIKLLGVGHYAKVVLPMSLILLFLSFSDSFLLLVDELFESNISEVKEVYDVKVNEQDRNFIKILLKEGNFQEGKSEGMRTFRSSGFISSMKNDIKSEPVIKETELKSGVKVERIKPEPAPEHKLRSVFVGKMKRFAVINDKMYRVGDILPSGEVLSEIDSGRVLVSGKWGKRWLFVKY